MSSMSLVRKRYFARARRIAVCYNFGNCLFRLRNIGIKINICISALERTLYLVYVGVYAANQWERLCRGQAGLTA